MEINKKILSFNMLMMGNEYTFSQILLAELVSSCKQIFKTMLRLTLAQLQMLISTRGLSRRVKV